jgi:hypothetical protein
MRGAIAPAPADDAAEQALLAEVRRQPLMDGLDLVPRVTARASYPWDRLGVARARRRAAPARRADRPRRRLRLRHQAQHPAPAGRPSGCRVTWCRRRRRPPRCWRCARRRVPVQRPRRSRRGDLRDRRGARAARRRQADLRHLPGPPDPRPGARRAHVQAAVRPPRRQPPGRRPRHRQGRDHLAEPRLRGRSGVACPGVRVSHENLYDGTVEGLAVDGRPVFSVQYHPEASPGPHDAHYLFARFREAMRAAR